jgi:chromosome segregation ATPase
VDDLSAARAQSEAEIENARAEIARLQREVADAVRAQRELEALRAPVEPGTEADRARQQLQAETARRQQAEKASAKLIEELQGFKRTFDDQSARRREAEALARACAVEVEKAGQQWQSASAERKRLEETSAALEREQAALRSEIERSATEHAEALAAAREQLRKETLERKRVEEEREILRREIAESKAALAEPAERGGEADQRAAEGPVRPEGPGSEGPKGADETQRELARGRQAQLLNKVLRKKLTEIRHAEQQAQMERQSLAQQIQSQAAELEKAKTDLRHEAASRQRTQEENQRLRRNLIEVVATAETLKAGREVVEEQAKKRADELARANAALQQELKKSMTASQRAGNSEEGWARRLFSSRKKTMDDRP